MRYVFTAVCYRYKNVQQVGFDEVSRTPPEQELHLEQDPTGRLEYPLKLVYK